MFKLGKLTDYGTVVMTALAARPDAMRNAHDLAAETHVAAPTVSKLLKQLQKSGLVESLRGVRGNWRLINTAIRQALESVTLAQMAEPMRGRRPTGTDSPMNFLRKLGQSLPQAQE